MNIWLLRWRIFYALKRARYCLFFFLFVLAISLLAPFIANEKPLFIYKDSVLFFPIFKDYPETAFGGDFDTTPDYKDPFVKNLLRDAIVIYPLIDYAPDSIDWELEGIPPTPPDSRHWLGTDDQGRDLASRLLYGLRISLVFGISLSLCTMILGVILGGLQGYYGGAVDLLGQRLSEIWGAVPVLFLIIIISSVMPPSFFIILVITLLFSWTSIASVVRAEFLRARNYEFVKAARVLGFGNLYIAFRHILPNALVATLTYLPFLMIGSITTLATLDFLGFGLPLGSPSLGELLHQGKNNLQAPHLGLTSFLSLALLLSSLVFIGEGVRDSFAKEKSM